MYADADWGGDLVTRRSTTGYMVMYAGSPITWKSKRQHAVAGSPAEAEYYAAGEACKDIIWLLHLFRDLGTLLRLPVVLYEDNQAVAKIADHPQNHQSTKHLDIGLR